MGCGVGERGWGGKGGGVGDGLLEQLFGFGGAMQADQGLGAIVEEGRVGVDGLGSDERGVERVGLLGVAGFKVDAGEEAGDGGVVGDLGVESFDERRGLGDLGGIARVEVGLR